LENLEGRGHFEDHTVNAMIILQWDPRKECCFWWRTGHAIGNLVSRAALKLTAETPGKSVSPEKEISLFAESAANSQYF
jgi:hypothetical protein